MALFMEAHSVEGLSKEQVAEVLAVEREALSRCGAISHKHWINERTANVHCLVSAPDEDTLRAVHATTGFAAHELTELFAPVDRWLACEAIDD